MERTFGGKRDVHDQRDVIRTYGAGERPTDTKHDLVQYISHVYDQGSLHCCTANALCSAYGLELMRQSMESNSVYEYFDSSRLFLYYNSRLYDETTDRNTGVSVRHAFKSMKKYGLCTEASWPYDEQNFSVEPSSSCYQEGLGNSIANYSRLDQDIDEFRACLKAGYPFTVGFKIYSSFWNLENNISWLMPVPTDDEIRQEKPLLHTVLAVGYDDDTQRITILNSWGRSFGNDGYFYMPYEYILNNKRAFDFWKIEEVSEGICCVS